MKVNNLVLKLTVPAAAFIATNAWAGKAADAISAETTGASDDLYAVGGIVAGLIVVGVIFGAAFRLFRKGG